MDDCDCSGTQRCLTLCDPILRPSGFALCDSSILRASPHLAFWFTHFHGHKAASVCLCSLMHRLLNDTWTLPKATRPTPIHSTDHCWQWTGSRPWGFSQGLLKVFSIKGGQAEHTPAEKRDDMGFINWPMRARNHKDFLSTHIFRLQLWHGQLF